MRASETRRDGRAPPYSTMIPAIRRGYLRMPVFSGCIASISTVRSKDVRSMRMRSKRSARLSICRFNWAAGFATSRGDRGMACGRHHACDLGNGCVAKSGTGARSGKSLSRTGSPSASMPRTARWRSKAGRKRAQFELPNWPSGLKTRVWRRSSSPTLRATGCFRASMSRRLPLWRARSGSRSSRRAVLPALPILRR